MADTPIDTLIIDIEAKASNADKAIDKFANAIGNLANSLARVDTGKLNSVGNGIQSLGTVSENVASVGELASNISRLGNKSVQTAVTNIPQLATALKGLMTTLSKAPKVSQNVIDMTNALANLSPQGSKVGSASNSIAKGLNRTSASATKANKSLGSLSSTIGKLYANFMQVVRVVKNLWNSVESTADYLEAFNYFEVALNKVGGDWSSDYEKYGYENAEAYADSFKTRLNKSLSGLSGVQISIDTNGETGLLADTGTKNLGLNIQEVTQYASQLASVTNSVGQTGEVTLAAASAFTKLGADMSSLFNVNYSSVMKNLQSGLIGQSRALYKYGIDITNATLQTYAYELGVEKAVSEMTQAEKMQLRMIAILDQSKVAWGDQANTINSLSNSIRQFKNNISEAGQILGQLFVPILSKVMPVVNGLVIAIKRLMVSIAGLMGIKIDLSSFGQSTSDIADEMDDLSESYDNAAESANKLKKATYGFDEINANTAKDTSSSETTDTGSSLDLTSDILKATEEYESAWSKAFANMENKAQAYADKIVGIFSSGNYQEVGEKISEKLTNAINSIPWSKIYNAARSFGSGFASFLNGLISPSLFSSVGRTIASALNTAIELALSFGTTFNWENLGESIGTGINSFFKTYNFKALAKTLNVWVRGIWKAITTAIKKIRWKTVWDGVKEFLEEIDLEAVAIIIGALTIRSIAKLHLGSSALSLIGNTLSVAIGQSLASKLGLEIEKNAGIGEALNAGLSKVISKIGIGNIAKGALGAVTIGVEFAVVKDSFEDIVRGSENAAANVAAIGVAATGAATIMGAAFGPAGAAVAGVTFLIGTIAGIGTAMQEINAEAHGRAIKEAMTNPGGTPINEVVENYSKVMQSIGDSFSVVSEKSSELETADSNIRNTWLEIEKIETAMDAGVLSVDDGTKTLGTLFATLAQTAKEKIGATTDTLLLAFGENGAVNSYYERLGISTEGFTSTMVQLNDKLGKRAEELTKQLDGMSPSDPNYAPLREELALVMGETNELTEAIDDYHFALEQIDYSNLFDEEGNIDTEALSELMGEISTVTEDAQKNVANAIRGLEKTLNQELDQALAIGDMDAANKIQVMLDAIPDVLKLAKEDIGSEALKITDTMQKDLIGGIDKVVENAEKEWDNLSPIKKTWNSMFGTNKDDYVKEAVKKQVESIGTVSSSIETEMKGLGIKGAGWGKEVSENLLDSMFEFDGLKVLSKNGSTTLNENYKEMIDEALGNLPSYAEDKGEDTVEGYNTGISDNSKTSKETIVGWQNTCAEAPDESNMEYGSPSKLMKKYGRWTVEGFNNGISEYAKTSKDAIVGWMNENVNAIHGSAFKFGSPSKKMTQFGQWAVEGFNNGITGAQGSAVSAAITFAKEVSRAINAIISSTADVGENVMQGIYNGLTGKEDMLYNKARTIANNVAKTIRASLEIHSPSKVMYELGGYTIEGFKEGMESLYRPTIDSLNDFSCDVRIPEMKIAPLDYGAKLTGFATENSYNEQITEGIRQAVVDGMMEVFMATNGNDSGDGQTIEIPMYIGEEQIAKATSKGISSLKRRGVILPGFA